MPWFGDLRTALSPDKSRAKKIPKRANKPTTPVASRLNAIRALRSHSASKSLSASVVAGIELHHPAVIPPIVSCHSAMAAPHRALETRLCPSRCCQKGEGGHGRGIRRGCHRYCRRHDGRDLSDVAARLTRSGSLPILAAIRRASSRTARAALIDDRCGR